MTYILKMFNTWQITLPKSRRKRYDTQSFIAEETSQWLLIKPLLKQDDSSAYFQTPDEFGIYYPKGIDAQKLILEIKQIQDE
jgi:hypothetical protein